jgi:hypothetical protein
VGWRATGGESAVRRITNLFRRDSVASLLVHGEAWKQPTALRRLAKRLSGGSRGRGRNAGKARRGKRRDLSAWVRTAGVRAFIVPLPHAARGAASKTGPREGRQEGGGGRSGMKQGTVSAVPKTAKQETEARGREWWWAEASIWTDRMVSALVNGVKGDKWAQGMVRLLPACHAGRVRLCRRLRATAAARHPAQAGETAKHRPRPGRPSALAQCLLRKRRLVHPSHGLRSRETLPMRKPPTGEPCAGKPHARFGGRGAQASLPLSMKERR